jgi:hypothetical protein
VRAQPRWILAALLVLAGLVIVLVRTLGPAEVSAAASSPAKEPEAPRSEPAPSLQAIPQELVREIPPESMDDDLESYPESSESVVASDSGESTLVVTMLGGNRPIGPGVLQVDRVAGGGSQTSSVDAATGRALFGNLSAGWWAIHLYQLPEGWLPPRDADESGPDGARLVKVQIHAGANQHDLVLRPAVRVFGQVLGPDGERFEGTRVRFTAFESTGGRARETPVEFVVDSGRYSGELHDGVWMAEVPWFGARKDGRGRELPFAIVAPPSAQVRMLHQGPAVEIDFVCERGPGVVEGRVVDEAGRPFQDLRVFATRDGTTVEPESGTRIEFFQRTGLAVTEEDGSFEFRGIAYGKYVLSVDAGEYLALARPGINAVGAPFGGAAVDVGAGGPTRIEIQLRRSHPVHVHGRIEADAAVASETPNVFVQMGVPGGSGTTRWSVDAPKWAFDFYVEAAVTNPVLEVECGGKKATYPITLSPDAEPPPFVLRFPK